MERFMALLAGMAREYYVRGEYQITREEPGFFAAQKELEEGGLDRILVWADDTVLAASKSLGREERPEREKREAALLKDFREKMSEVPGAAGFFLAPPFSLNLRCAFSSGRRRS
jgi:hypothetical protein